MSAGRSRRWIARAHEHLWAVAEDDTLAAPELLDRWLSEIFATKRTAVVTDPELFETYCTLAAEHSEAVSDHVDDLVDRTRAIIAAGVASGDFRPVDPDRMARAVFDATARFHHPAHCADWQDAGIEDEFAAVRSLVVESLRMPPQAAPDRT